MVERVAEDHCANLLSGSGVKELETLSQGKALN